MTSPRVSVSLERGLANWPAMRPIFTTGIEAPYVSTTAICSTVFTRLRIWSAVAPAKVSAQSPPCSRNASPREAAASRVAQHVDLAREDERRQRRELSGCRVRGLGVGPLRLLLDRQRAPIVEAVDHGGICVDDWLDELYHGSCPEGSGAVRREWERGAARRAAAAFEPTAIGRARCSRTELA